MFGPQQFTSWGYACFIIRVDICLESLNSSPNDAAVACSRGQTNDKFIRSSPTAFNVPLSCFLVVDGTGPVLRHLSHQPTPHPGGFSHILTVLLVLGTRYGAQTVLQQYCMPSTPVGPSQVQVRSNGQQETVTPVAKKQQQNNSTWLCLVAACTCTFQLDFAGHSRKLQGNAQLTPSDTMHTTCSWRLLNSCVCCGTRGHLQFSCTKEHFLCALVKGRP
jgi:hypothetical protein